MKTTTFVVGIIIALTIGGGIGYSSGKSMNNNSVQTKELQDSITMMKEQSKSIQTMAEIMKTGGIKMQEIGMELKNDDAISKGKDIEMMGEKYIKENIKAVESSGTMNSMMNK